MKTAIICIIGLVGSWGHAAAESLLEGRVRLDSGAPVPGAQVLLFDLADLRAAPLAATTDRSGQFTLPLATLGGALPERFELGANYPNPFNPSTMIPYQLPAAMYVRLEVFNILGQRIATLVDGERPAGFHTAHWDATDAAGEAVAAGVYLYRLSGDGVQATRSMLLIDGQAGIPSGRGGSSGSGGEAGAGEDGEAASVYGLTVSGPELVPYVDPAFRVQAGMAPLDLVVEAPGRVPPAKAASSGGILGDVDNTGDVDFFDALLVALYSRDSSIVMPNNGDISLGDVNADGQVDLADAWAIAAYLNDPSDPALPAGIGEPAGPAASLSPDPSTVTFADDGAWHRFTVAAGEPVSVVANPGADTPRLEITTRSGRGNYCPAEADDDASREDGQAIYLSGCATGTVAVELRREADGSVLRTYTFEVTGSPADLVVESVSVSDSTLTPGQSFMLSATVRNQGTGAASATTLRWYRSSNRRITTRDTQVGTDAVGALAAAGTSAESIRLTAPSNVGTYYYGACVASVAGESAGNNCSAGVRVTVEAASPDLIVELVSVSDSTLTLGQSFTLSATVRNQGTAESAATTLRYYRSSNRTISWQDTQVGSDAVDGLAASATSAESISLTAPSSEGTYYYGACVATVAGEADTRNNCSAAVTITVAVVTPPGAGGVKNKMYWAGSRGDKIQRSNLDGSGVEGLVTTGLGFPAGIALDVSGGKMYWTDHAQKIQRSNLDGSGVEDLVTTGLRRPHGIALDVSGGKMYWTDLDTDKIQRSNLDGSGVEDLVTGLGFPQGIALDVSGGKMYWTDQHTEKIHRSNLDGSGVEDLVTGLGFPKGIALDVSGGKMYWTDSVTRKIHRSNLDGSGVEDLVTGLGFPQGIALDVSGGKMYWTDARKIQRSNLDGSGVEDLVTGLEYYPGGIALGFGVPVEAGTDLGVPAASVSDNILTPGQSFTLSATVHNWGTEPAAATTLRYYRSDDATIDNTDTEVGTDAVRGLAAGGASDQSISLTAPSSAGTSYYGACVESVSGERNTGNNCSSGVSVSHVPSPIVRIPDANLRAVIEAALGTASGAPITVAKMETLRGLRANYAGISDLTGLEFATYLTNISLVDNNITDVSPLSGLTYLRGLQLAGNKIMDQSVLASCLRSLTNLDLLTLGGTGFADISPLSGLTNLSVIELQQNGISDISPLSGLTNLEALWLESNNITDISPLGGLTNLISIVLLNNNITDLSPIFGLTNLEWLHLNGNNITESDISSLSGLTNLSVLELSSSNITDLSSLSGLTNLSVLELSSSNITDLSSLSGLTNLTDLRLSDSNITDLSPLWGLTNLSVLDLSFNNITDISSLSGLTNLSVLNLYSSNITDLSPLSGLTYLSGLNLSSSNITDLSPLSGLTYLSGLNLSFNNITDISSLVGLTNLTGLDLRGNALSLSSINDHIATLESRGVTVRFERLRKGDFDIELVFLDPFTEVQKRVLQYAARRWMSVITEDLPEYEFTQGWSRTCGDQSFEIPSGERIDDLRIYVTSFNDNPHAVGWGGPSLLREATYLPVLGCMGFDLARAYLLTTGLHEIGHVLGFGRVWDELGFYQNPPNGDQHFNGPLAIAAFDDAGGWDYKGKKVPLYDRAHWRRSAFWSSQFPESPGELMMPGGGGALSAITVQSFADLGYGVDVTQADPYTLPGAASAKASAKVVAAMPARPGVDVTQADAYSLPGADPHGQWSISKDLLLLPGDDRWRGHLARSPRAVPELSCGAGLRREPIHVIDAQGYIVRTISSD